MKPRPTTHCIHGHALTGDNLYVRPDGTRKCRTCDRVLDAVRRGGRRRTDTPNIASRPSDEVIAEAQRRAAAVPRDLTGILLGDPPVGFSMLDRRQSA